MREEALHATAGVVAASLVGAMDDEDWPRLRNQVANVLSGGDPRRAQVINARLEASRGRLVRLQPELREQAGVDVAAEWRRTINGLLWEQPTLVRDLRAVLAAQLRR
ncbi:hypothetical protein [Umezawaea beigongshangensis]|uniref:hypothetical protein n=1 Tax=Umezawaea beigongshangensis TaxID=2780383 RepID=UPI0018F24F33|nr:hypothetical protein [Umezawaea beigongshangensis]